MSQNSVVISGKARGPRDFGNHQMLSCDDKLCCVYTRISRERDSLECALRSDQLPKDFCVNSAHTPKCAAILLSPVPNSYHSPFEVVGQFEFFHNVTQAVKNSN
jgi:hypothetical protein